MVVAPFLLANDYYISVLILASINALIVIGLNLLLGYAGQISLGHAAFFGLAAYMTAISTVTWGMPIWLGMILGVALSAIVGYVIAVPTLKLKGHYLAMATLGFGIIVYIVFNETIELTGGPSGFIGIPRLELLGFTFESDLSYYYVMVVTLVLGVLFALNLIDSRTGRALRAIHVSEKAAASMGVNITGYKRFIFVLSAVFAGVAGVLYAHYLGFIAPSSFGFHFSVQLITMVVLGGMASVWGAVAGAFFLTTLPEFLRVLEDVDILVYGLIMILCMIYLPGGIAGGLESLFRRVRQFFSTKSAQPTDSDSADQDNGGARVR
nr:branched-chain amino acid ABC transporter permease [Desulfovibrio inopinatus]